jgi:hypothetical protein
MAGWGVRTLRGGGDEHDRGGNLAQDSHWRDREDSLSSFPFKQPALGGDENGEPVCAYF